MALRQQNILSLLFVYVTVGLQLVPAMYTSQSERTATSEHFSTSSIFLFLDGTTRKVESKQTKAS